MTCRKEIEMTTKTILLPAALCGALVALPVRARAQRRPQTPTHNRPAETAAPAPSALSPEDALAAMKADITFEVLSDSGKIKIKDGYAVYSAVPADRKYRASYPLEPEAGNFANGAYQLKLLMDGKVVALLNWSVGDH